MARCFAVIGAANTGKSTLTDGLAGLEGGEVQKAEGEGEMRIVPFRFMGEDWTALDCPGSIELLHDASRALLAADAAVICVSPDPEAAALSAPYIRMAEAAGVPSILFINRIDEARGRVRDIVSGLQAYAGHVIILRQIPMREDGKVVGAVDLVSERAWRYREGERSALVTIPAELSEREHEARDELLESLSDFDDALLEQIIEDETPEGEAVYEICARVLADAKAHEALIGAGGHGNGVLRLMKALRHEAPGVEALLARRADEIAALGADPLAVAFHARHRRHVGRTVYLRALADGVATGAQLGGGALGALADGAGAAIAPGAAAGAVKSDHLPGVGLLSAEGAVPAPDWVPAGAGQIARIISPKAEKDEVKLSSTLARIAEDDPGLVVAQDPQTGAQRAEAQGPMHLRLLRDTLSEVFGLDTEEHPVPPVYREAVTRTANVHYRHKKQTGGAGQFADVHITLAPLPRGSGFVFEETVKGGAVPRNYIPAVEHGAREALEKGPLGFPVLDVKVTLTDGQAHSVDSSDMAFRIAGRSAVQEALEQAAPVLLQPVHEVRIFVPSVFTGALGAVVSSLKGHVLGFDRDPDATGWDIFRAQLPGASLDELSGQLRGATQGVGRFEHEFDHFEEIYGREAQRIVEERGAA